MPRRKKMETPSKQPESSNMTHEEEEEMQHDISKLQDQVQQMSLAQKVTKANMGDLKKEVEAKMDGLKKSMEAKMDGLKKGVEAKMNGVEAKMDGLKKDIEAKMNGMEAKTDNVEAKEKFRG